MLGGELIGKETKTECDVRIQVDFIRKGYPTDDPVIISCYMSWTDYSFTSLPTQSYEGRQDYKRFETQCFSRKKKTC